MDKLFHNNRKYWLLKSEPNSWSWTEQLEAKVTYWDGVRNYQAAKFINQMKINDLAFFYHSGKQRAIIGIVKIVSLSYPDHTDKTGKFVMVDVEALYTLEKPVSLSTIKSINKLQNLKLIKQPRLSVMPIELSEWLTICNLTSFNNV